LSDIDYDKWTIGALQERYQDAKKQEHGARIHMFRCYLDYIQHPDQNMGKQSIAAMQKIYNSLLSLEKELLRRWDNLE